LKRTPEAFPTYGHPLKVLDYPFNPRGVHRVKAHLRLKGRRVVDEGRNFAQSRINLPIKRQDVGLGTDIGLNRDHMAPVVRNIANHLLGRVVTALKVDADRVST
jgi:hypothetical protein